MGTRKRTAQGRSSCFLVTQGRELLAPTLPPAPARRCHAVHRASHAALSKDAAQWPAWQLKAGNPTAYLIITHTFQKSLKYYLFGSSVSMESSLGLYGKMLGRLEAPGESLSLDLADTVAAGALQEGSWGLSSLGVTITAASPESTHANQTTPLSSSNSTCHRD